MSNWFSISGFEFSIDFVLLEPPFEGGAEELLGVL